MQVPLEPAPLRVAHLDESQPARLDLTQCPASSARSRLTSTRLAAGGRDDAQDAVTGGLRCGERSDLKAAEGDRHQAQIGDGCPAVSTKPDVPGTSIPTRNAGSCRAARSTDSSSSGCAPSVCTRRCRSAIACRAARRGGNNRLSTRRRRRARNGASNSAQRAVAPATATGELRPTRSPKLTSGGVGTEGTSITGVADGVGEHLVDVVQVVPQHGNGDGGGQRDQRDDAERPRNRPGRAGDQDLGAADNG